MFLGKKLDGRTTAELGSDFRTRIQGTCLKHHLGWAAIKMYGSPATSPNAYTPSNLRQVSGSLV